MYNNFDLEKTWKFYDSSNQISVKTKILIELIPKDVRTIIDIGCGNGIITNELDKVWDVTGLDSSAEALKYVKGKKIQASATEIPCLNNSFDLVLSSEMLEHLSDRELSEAVKEMMRLSKRYILLTVPNDEFLDASIVKCLACNNTFHAWQHFQSFNIKRLVGLFKSEFKLLYKCKFGPKQGKWNPLLLKLIHYQGQWFSPGNSSICPSCGNTSFSQYPRNIITKICNGLNRLSGTKPYWTLVLLEKK
jgi:ubiquinone/menaquinone biosynthesis C-methylase UbiE